MRMLQLCCCTLTTFSSQAVSVINTCLFCQALRKFLSFFHPHKKKKWKKNTKSLSLKWLKSIRVPQLPETTETRQPFLIPTLKKARCSVQWTFAELLRTKVQHHLHAESTCCELAVLEYLDQKCLPFLGTGLFSLFAFAGLGQLFFHPCHLSSLV